MLVNRSMPNCTVIPVLPYRNVGEAVEWLCAAFGFQERWRAGDHRAQLSVGDGAVVVTEGAAQEGAKASHSVMVRVEDADRHHQRALQLGAQILQPPTDYPYGERQYTAEDIGGHRWSFSESIADVAPEEWGGTSSRSE
jgi:uncharacterized glyoxalase superfamily protein PhnB